MRCRLSHALEKQINGGEHGAGVRCVVGDLAKGGGAGKPARIPGDVLSRQTHGRRAVMGQHIVKMKPHHPPSACKVGLRARCAPGQNLAGLAKQPGFALRAAPYHDTASPNPGTKGKKSLRIGLLIPASGTAGIWGPSCRASAELAVTEINRHWSNTAEIRFVDAGAAPNVVASNTSDLVRSRQVDAIVGMHTSDVRDAVAARIGRQIPYIYTPLHEGRAPEKCNLYRGDAGQAAGAGLGLDAPALYAAAMVLSRQ